MFSRSTTAALILSLAGPCQDEATLRPQVLEKTLALEFKQAVLDLPWHAGQDGILLPVEVNGRGPYLFALDTGSAARALVDHQLVRELQLESVGGALSADAGGERAFRRRVRLDRLQLGALEFTEIDAMAGDLSFLGGGTARVHGILGFRLFGDFLLQVDGPGRRVRLFRDRLKQEHPGVRSYRDRGVPYFWLESGDQQTWALIDTGFDGALGLPGSWREACETLAPARVTGRLQSLNSEDQRVWSARLSGDVEMAGYRFPQPPVAFLEGHRRGLIGIQALQTFVLTFDQQRRLCHAWLPPADS